jgi:hypothetical protein
VAWAHKANVAALTSSHDVVAYEFSGGWVVGVNTGAGEPTPVTT